MRWSFCVSVALSKWMNSNLTCDTSSRGRSVMPEHPTIVEAAASEAVNVNNVIDTLISIKTG